MRALRCGVDRRLEALSVEDVAPPVARPGEVVVDVEAACVNFVDALIVTGAYQGPVAAPFTPGNDLAGVVSSVGAGPSPFAVGDRVHGMAFVGAFAEQVAVPATRLRPTPEGMKPEVACTAGSAYRTGYDAVVTTAALRRGETIVVLGAAGSVGTAAIQVAKALGAVVIAVASSAAKRRFCLELGADDAIDADPSKLKDALKARCPAGIDAVLDPVGGELAEPALRACGDGGRYVVVGFASGTIPRMPLNLVLLKGVAIVGYEIATFERRDPGLAARNRDHLERLLADGVIVPPIKRRWTLEHAPLALLAAADRAKVGISILTIDRRGQAA